MADFEKIDLNELRDKLTEFLNRFGITGNAEITSTENDVYTIKFGDHTFAGFYPLDDNSLFTVQIVNSEKELPTELTVPYIEAFVFYVDGFVPYEFVIHQYPQTQTYFIADGLLPKGTIFYETFCPHTRCASGMVSGMKFQEPVFESDLISFDQLKEL